MARSNTGSGWTGKVLSGRIDTSIYDIQFGTYLFHFPDITAE